MSIDIDHVRITVPAHGVAGVDVIEGMPIPGCDRFELRDPFGNRLQFIQASRDDP